MAVVLVVEDDAQVVRTIGRILHHDGHTMESAGTVAEAQLALRSLDVDVVICDVNLPDGSGISLVRQVAEELRETAVFMLSGVEDPEIARTALELGATAYVVKPFTASEITINTSNSLRLRDLEREQRSMVAHLEATLAGPSGRLHDAVHAVAEAGGADALAEEVVHRLVSALSLRDDETGAHIERMSRYAAVLAKRCAVPFWTSDAVRLASVLHDVGKIGIPDGILLKPGRLTDRERAHMQRHAELGYELLVDSESDVVRLGAAIALTHHERWDGAGYPSGLAGTGIPIEGRVAAVADVFDALTSDRVYRAAMSIDEAVGILRAERAGHFDPDLVDLFVDGLDEILELRAAYPDPPPIAAIRILIVDDHEMFADGAARVLGREPTMEVVAVTGSAASATTLMAEHRPDVVVLDWHLPDGDGTAVARRLREIQPGAVIVVLSGGLDDRIVAEALDAGCAAFLSKEHTYDKLVATVIAAHAGEWAIPAARLTSALRSEHRPGHTKTDLTEREVEVLQLLARGVPPSDVAARVFLSPRTVRNYIQNAMAKLGAHSRVEAVAVAVRRGIITLR